MYQTGLTKAERQAVQVCVHPPYIFLDSVRRELLPQMAVGSQNVYDAAADVTTGNIPAATAGHTGAVTPSMLASIGCQYVLLGHSDRRNNLGETDNLIAQKIAIMTRQCNKKKNYP